MWYGVQNWGGAENGKGNADYPLNTQTGWECGDNRQGRFPIGIG